ncbi:MAG: sensor histidine kinase [Bacteroidia bacterium]|nr:sensor histidine kinase [Bacteroidia bacterium]
MVRSRLAAGLQGLYHWAWHPTERARSRKDILLKQLLTLQCLLVPYYLLVGLLEGNSQIAVASAAVLAGSVGLLALTNRGYGHLARPGFILLVFCAVYVTRLQDPRPLDRTDAALQVLVFEVALLPAVLLGNRFLQLALPTLIVVALVFLGDLIAVFGHAQMPVPSPLIVYSMWAACGLYATAILGFYNTLIYQSEQQITALLTDAQARNHDLENANEELRTLQQEIVRLEKLQIVERFVANVSHRLNSPLAALKAANARFSETALGYLQRLLVGPEMADPRDRQLIATYLQHLFQGQVVHETFLPYRKRKALLATLTTQLSPYATPERPAEQLAEAFLALGLHHLATLPQLYTHPDTLARLHLLEAPRQLHSLLSVHRSTIRALQLLSQNLRAYSRLNQYETPRWVELQPFVAALVADFRLQVPGLQVGLSGALPPSTGLTIRPTDLQSILLNLLVNAADAQDGQGEASLLLFHDPRYLYIEVSDPGPGLDPTVEAQLFQPFVTTKSLAEGLGMGLYVSRSLAESYGGTLTFHRDAATTRFTLSLPTELAPPAAA